MSEITPPLNFSDENLTPEQSAVVDAISSVIRFRSASGTLDLATSLPLVQESIRNYVQGAADEVEQQVRFRWVLTELKNFTNSFDFTQGESAVISVFFESLAERYKHLIQ